MRKTKWNDNWKFWEMHNSFALLWGTPADAEVVKLPHDAMLQHRAYAESSLGGNSGYRDGGHFCYSKTLDIKEKAAKYLLKFDGIYANAAVYVNGNLILRHPNGYTSFLADLSSYLEVGKQNEIIVMTQNKAASERWYTGGGILRDVHLLTAEKTVYIQPESPMVKTRDINQEEASGQVEISAVVRNDSASDISAALRIELSDSQVLWTERVNISASSEQEIRVLASIENASFWSEEDPNLYEITAELYCFEGDSQLLSDSATARFGIRRLDLDPENGLRINGISKKLRGSCIHADNGVIGAVEIKDAIRRKIRKLKESGFNAIRVAHHPASEALLEVCDELGMLVMNEAFDMWTRNKNDYDYANYFMDWWERDVKSMVTGSMNHPCVIMYSLGNEIPEIGIEGGRRICKMLHDKVKELDDSRYTTVAINGVFSVGDVIPQIVHDILGGDAAAAANGNVNEFLNIMDTNADKIVLHDIISERVDKAAEIVDIAGYNYMVARYEGDVKESPDRIIVGSETYPYTIARVWPEVMKHPQLIGDFCWTGWDYIGEAGVGIPAYKFREGGFGAMFPCQLAYTGDLDITGFRRPASYYREMAFGLRKDPYIAVNDPAHFNDHLIKTTWVVTAGVANWNYPGMEGQPVSVEVFSPGDEVELLLNGRSFGRKKTEADNCYMAEFEVSYEKGELKAVSYENGEVTGEFSLKTPEKEYHLHVAIEENNEELAYVDITCQDENGLVYQASEETIHVKTEGSIGSWLGTGNPKPLSNYTDMETQLWNGRALLVIRKDKPEDKVKAVVWTDKESVELSI